MRSDLESADDHARAALAFIRLTRALTRPKSAFVGVKQVDILLSISKSCAWRPTIDYFSLYRLIDNKRWLFWRAFASE